MELTPQQIKLLKDIRGILPNHSPLRATNAMYVSPAQAMRNAADNIEYEERLTREFDALLELIK